MVSRAGSLYTGVSGSDRRSAERVPTDTGDLARYWRLYKGVPLIRASFEQARDDVLTDGYRWSAAKEGSQTFLEEWSKSAGTDVERGQDLYVILKMVPIQLFARGTVLLEHNPAEADGAKTAGVSFINPSTVTPYRASDTDLLLRPDDTEYDGVKLTEDGKAAAYVQFDAGPNNSSTDERRLTLDSVTRMTIGGDIGDVFGVSRTAAVADRVDKLLGKLDDNDRAIAAMAWGQWFVGFDHETVENEDGSETIVEWEDDDMKEFMGDMDNIEPGDIEGHDGTIDIKNLPGNVADIIDQLKYETHWILSGMPAPTYSVGFEQDINQFVVDGQEHSHEQRIGQLQGMIERNITPIGKMVLNQNNRDATDTRFRLEPPAESSPILNLSDNEMNRLLQYAQAFSEVAGGEPRTLLPDDVIREEILQMENVDVSQIERGPEDGEQGGLSAEDLENMTADDFAELGEQNGDGQTGEQQAGEQ